MQLNFNTISRPQFTDYNSVHSYIFRFDSTFTVNPTPHNSMAGCLVVHSLTTPNSTDPKTIPKHICSVFSGGRRPESFVCLMNEWIANLIPRAVIYRFHGTILFNSSVISPRPHQCQCQSQMCVCTKWGRTGWAYEHTRDVSWKVCV